MSSQDRPLEGIVVLDLTRLLPGPFMTMVLADLGADVIKVEGPGLGDYLRSMPPRSGEMSGRFLAINRGKRSVCLDLKTKLGCAAFLRMVRRSDIVIESFRPGVMERLGLGYDDLRRERDDIIVCSISGYGQSGPYRERAGHDLNYIGTAGVLAMTGNAGAEPVMPGIQVADLAGGALWSLSGVLAALFGRDRGAGGTHLDISMTEGALAMLATEIGNLGCEGAVPTRGTGTLGGGLACYRVYRCKDERYLSVAALEPKFWIAFNAALGRTASPSEVMAGPEQQEVIATEIAGLLRERTAEEWRRIFAATDCCVDVVLEVDELEHHPQHRERGVFFSMQSGSGNLSQIRMPLGDAQNCSPPPKHGEHTLDVLRQFGFTLEECEALAPTQ